MGIRKIGLEGREVKISKVSRKNWSTVPYKMEHPVPNLQNSVLGVCGVLASTVSYQLPAT